MCLRIPSQQSAPVSQLLPVTPVAWQLLVPQTRPLAQWLSTSQSPWPALHWLVDVQHVQSVDGIPSQFGATVGPGVVVGAVDGANKEVIKRIKL